jgi:hypothetical protein
VQVSINGAAILPEVPQRERLMQIIINGAAILPEAPQRERLEQVREEGALEFLSGGIERIKDVKCPSLDCQEAIYDPFYQILIQSRNGAAKVQKWVQGILKSTQEASDIRYSVQPRNNDRC